MRKFSFAIGVGVVLAFCELGYAQATDALSFPGGLAFSAPSGWVSSVVDTNTLPSEHSGSFENPNVLTLLFQARPSDTLRSGVLTVVRDESLDRVAGPALKQAMQVRLAEAAARQGFRPESFEFFGRLSPEGAHSGKLRAISADNKYRIFTCVELNNMSGASFRCFWENDEADTATENEYEAWMGSVSFDGVRVADALSGTPSKTLVATTKPSGSLGPAASTAATPSASPGVTTRETADLAAKSRNALVVIEGENGRGSGFLCQINNQPTFFTNIHVLSDNPNPRYTTMNGKTFNLGESSLGVGHDVFKAAVPEVPDMLEVMADMDANARIGDPIAVLGNAEGAGVIKPFEGRIVGIGPNLVEVDAPFVPGNSGSPIIHLPTGKVIGIATYVVTRKISEKKGEVETTVRRFGYRLDSIKSWEPLNWATFNAQSAQASKIEETGEEFARFFKAMAKDKEVSSLDFRYLGIQRALYSLETASRANSRMSAADLAAVYRRFLVDLRAAALSDVNAFDVRTAYDYFKREIAEEKKFREEIYESLSRTIESNR